MIGELKFCRGRLQVIAQEGGIVPVARRVDADADAHAWAWLRSGRVVG